MENEKARGREDGKGEEERGGKREQRMPGERKEWRGKRRRKKKRAEERKKSKSGRRRIMAKTEKKGENTRIVKSSHKSKWSTFLKREILVVSETGGWKSPLNMHDVMYCTFTTRTRPHSIC